MTSKGLYTREGMEGMEGTARNSDGVNISSISIDMWHNEEQAFCSVEQQHTASSLYLAIPPCSSLFLLFRLFRYSCRSPKKAYTIAHKISIDQ